MFVYLLCLALTMEGKRYKSLRRTSSNPVSEDKQFVKHPSQKLFKAVKLTNMIEGGEFYTRSNSEIFSKMDRDHVAVYAERISPPVFLSLAGKINQSL